MTIPGLLPDEFSVAPLSRISPSRFLGLKSCRLREIWASSREPALLPLNARAHLGTIIHALLAVAGRGELPSGIEVENYWANVLSSTEREMLGSWLERSLVPLSKSVGSYSVDALRAIKKAREIASCGRFHGVTGSPSPTGRGFELWVHTSDNRVGGYIDHVYNDDSGIVIRDYKSGYVFESNLDNGLVIRDAFALQLRLYAALYSVTFGQWPARLELTPTEGPSVAVPFDTAQCVNLVDEAKKLLDEINGIVLRINEKHLSQVSLAAPSPEACRHCSYRPNCSAYRTVKKDLDAGWPFDLWGVVKRVQTLMNGQLAVILETSNGTETLRGISPEGRHPALANVAAGQRLAFFNLQKSYPAAGMREGLYTTIYRCSS